MQRMHMTHCIHVPLIHCMGISIAMRHEGMSEGKPKFSSTQP